MNVGIATYLVGAIAFLVLSILLLTSWRGRLQGGLLVAAVVGTTLWSAFLAFALAATVSVSLVGVLSAEIVRSSLWLVFLLQLSGAGRGVALPSKLRYAVVPFCVGLLAYTLVAGFIPASVGLQGLVLEIPSIGLCALALIGLILLEQLYRNSPASQRYAIKFLCIGVGAMFAYDLVIYSYAGMLQHVSPTVWNARGLIYALIVPLLAVSAARNPKWSLDVFVSRQMVFYSTTLLGAGIYLLAVAAGGYYIRLYGGSWGTLASVVFVFGGGVVLLILLFSGQARARLRVFLSKHFFNYRYDYREEWLRLIATLARSNEQMPLPRRSIMALAQITDSPGGVLWVRSSGALFKPAESWNMRISEGVAEPANSAFARFLEERQWIYNVAKSGGDQSQAAVVKAPDWLSGLSRAWIVVPLLHDTEMMGFVVLDKPRSAHDLNWEDLDLLKTAGRQVASYLGYAESARKLAEAQQFEGYNRLTAFVMHDLKNVVAQQTLMVSNAERHKANPAFVDDMIKTVSNSVDRMNRLLDQLQRGDAGEGQRRIPVQKIVRRAIEETESRDPAPVLRDGADNNSVVHVEEDRFCAILGHVIRNAQDATPANGRVDISLYEDGSNAMIDVHDNGSGMDSNFIRDKLFQPFYSTKSSKGMGIGAYQVREYVTSIGGKVRIKSEVGRGTTFTISLPLAPDQENLMTLQSATARGAAQ